MLEAAETHADAAISADRRFCLAHYLRADLRVQTAERNHIAEIEGLIREAGLVAQKRDSRTFGPQPGDQKLSELRRFWRWVRGHQWRSRNPSLTGTLRSFRSARMTRQNGC
jgi:hypothetical protein